MEWVNQELETYIPKAVHLESARGMVFPTPYGRICSQLHHPLCHPTDPILPDDGI